MVPADAHGCPGCPHPSTGPAIAGSPNVMTNGRPSLRVDDPGIHAACCGANTWSALTGSATVLINGKAAHRMNDQTRHCGGIGMLIEGSPDVIVGDSTSSGGGIGDSDGPGGSGPGAPSGSGGSGGAPSGGSGGSSGGSGGSGAGSGPVAPPVPTRPPADSTHYIEIDFVDGRGFPMSGEPYQIVAPDGRKVTGKLDAEGRARVDNIPQGVCEVSFPKLIENSRKVPR